MNKNELLKVMIVDDEEMIRRGLRAIVDWKGNTATPFAVTPQMEKTAIKRRWFISRI